MTESEARKLAKKTFGKRAVIFTKKKKELAADEMRLRHSVGVMTPPIIEKGAPDFIPFGWGYQWEDAFAAAAMNPDARLWVEHRHPVQKELDARNDAKGMDLGNGKKLIIVGANEATRFVGDKAYADMKRGIIDLEGR